jgi:hypothetical protein
MIEAKEAWSFYRLSDGTTLRIKPVMIGVFRADGQQTADGEPVYSMKSTLITDVTRLGQLGRILRLRVAEKLVVGVLGSKVRC